MQAVGNPQHAKTSTRIGYNDKMSSAVSTPMRTASWNVRLTIGGCDRRHEFVGIYQNPRGATLTFADMCGFELPSAQSDARQDGDDGDDAVDTSADSITFALTDAPEDTDSAATGYPAFVAHESLHGKNACSIVAQHTAAENSHILHYAPQILHAYYQRLAQGLSSRFVLHQTPSNIPSRQTDVAQYAHYLPKPHRFRHPSKDTFPPSPQHNAHTTQAMMTTGSRRSTKSLLHAPLPCILM